MFDDKKKCDCDCVPDKISSADDCTCEVDDDCDCGPEEITLIGEDGSSMQFILLGATKVDDKEYAALAELDSNDFIVFEIRQVDEYYEFLDIENDEEYNRVGAAFEQYFAEEDETGDEPAAPPKKERPAKGKHDKSKPARPAGGAKSGRPHKR